MDCAQARRNGGTGAGTGASFPAVGTVPGIGAGDSNSCLEKGVMENKTDVDISAEADACIETDGGGANVVAAVGIGSGATTVGTVAKIGIGDNNAGHWDLSKADDEVGVGAVGAADAGATPVARDGAGAGANGFPLGSDAGGCKSKFSDPPLPELMVSTCRKSECHPPKMMCSAKNVHHDPYSRSSPRDYSWRRTRKFQKRGSSPSYCSEPV